MILLCIFRALKKAYISAYVGLRVKEYTAHTDILTRTDNSNILVMTTGVYLPVIMSTISDIVLVSTTHYIW